MTAAVSETDHDMPRIQAPPNLPHLVKTAFSKARDSGDLTYFPTQVTILNVNSVPFQLRFSPSLANKPKHTTTPSSSAGAGGAAAEKPSSNNPFADQAGALSLGALGPAHTLFLNKFAVVPEHFILATRAFERQTDLLAEGDLEAAWACIRAYEEEEEEGDARELFVFFNSGAHSGASQPHRHLQLLDVRNMRGGLEGPERDAWAVLADRVVGGAAEGAGVGAVLPFWTAGRAVREDERPRVTGRVLREWYLDLYRRACRRVEVDGAEGQTEGEARISYNLALTRRAMVLCPRVCEGGLVRGESGEEVGWLALNGTVLAGTALVKSEAEWDALRRDPGQVREVLGKIGVSV